MYVDVILPLPLYGLFTYKVSPEHEPFIKTGVRVLVPLGKSKRYIGIIHSINDNPPQGFEVKEVLMVLDENPILLSEQLKLWQWISDYYLSPIGEVYKAAIPVGMKSVEGYKPKTETFVRLADKYSDDRGKMIALDLLGRSSQQKKLLLTYFDLVGGGGNLREISRDELLNESHCTATIFKNLMSKGILTTYEKTVARINDNTDTQLQQAKALNEYQQDAYNQILLQFIKKNVVLLHGVTSSGKTEIYIHLILQALEKKQQVLYLLPEIALTVQIMTRLKSVFGNRLGIYHSKYSDAERVEIWNKQMSENPYDIILGARSAVFMPFKNLGLVIIDEEHETSFKQQDPMPRYHARSAAIVLAQMYGAKTLLGTATPSIESYSNALSGKYGLVTLGHRYKNIELPEITVVDIKDLRRRKMMSGAFSPLLLAKIREALANGEQAIIFQNRRGFAPHLECHECGWVPHCKNCDVSLTLHKSTDTLTCHYCGFTYRIPDECPNCGSKDLRDRGFGTEKVEDQISDLFPEAKVNRMDLDTTRSRTAYEKIISDFSSGKSNLLIGTQMISKGLDFDKVSVVGILDADSIFNMSDFRAYEHAFQMMSQVSGRAGRKGKRGCVILQTKSPDLALVHQVVNNDYQSFYRSQIEERRTFRYPPFCRLIYVYLRHAKDYTVQSASVEMGTRLRHIFGERVLGPDKPAVAKVKNKNIRKLIIKIEPNLQMSQVRDALRITEQALMSDKRYSSLQIYFDVDPL